MRMLQLRTLVSAIVLTAFAVIAGCTDPVRPSMAQAPVEQLRLPSAPRATYNCNPAQAQCVDVMNSTASAPCDSRHTWSPCYDPACDFYAYSSGCQTGDNPEYYDYSYCRSNQCHMEQPNVGDPGEPGGPTGGPPPEWAPTIIDDFPSYPECPVPAECVSAAKIAQSWAFLQGMSEARALTKLDGKEHGAFIFQNPDGTYRVGEMYTGTICENGNPCTLQLRNPPPGAVGSFHTHPYPSQPSGPDYTNAQLNDIYVYVVTPTQIWAIGPSGQIVGKQIRPNP